jgi:hypothetical protein
VVWTELIWLRLGTSGRFSWTQWRTFRFHTILKISWVAA